MPSENLSTMGLTGLTYPELASSSNIQYFIGREEITASYPRISPPSLTPLIVQVQQAMHGISVVSVGSSLEELSSELGIRIEPDAEDLIERMTLTGELDLGRFLRGVSTLIRRVREILPEGTCHVSIESFEDPEVEGWRAPVISFEIDSTDLNEIDDTWDRLIEIAGEAFGEEEGEKIYIFVRPRLRGSEAAGP